ncbi:MAG: hypothetical protein QMD03_00965 [Syntrophales bacterium]|nr:hypothetical protein [Syntrophales bacterium]
MIVANKREFTKGLLLSVSFLIVLGIMFTPVFGGGRNAFQAADRLFNSIAKGSTYYIPKVLKENEEYKGRRVDIAIKLDNEEMAKKTGQLFSAAGASVSTAGNGLPLLKVNGDLGRILEAAIRDSDVVFYNRGEEIAQKYGFPQKEVLFVWHKGFKALNKALTKQERFTEATWVEEVMKRTIEVAYNFYKIEPRSASSSVGILSVSLGFYVLYTLWWGYAILFLFEGLGLQMKAGHKKEV